MTSRLKPVAAAMAMLFVQCSYADDELPPLVVTATRQDTRVSQSLSDVTILSAEDIRRAGPNTSLAELLGRQPGIEFTQNGGAGATSSIYVRGSNANHVLLLIDGQRVGSASSGAPAWEAIPLAQIEQIGRAHV